MGVWHAPDASLAQWWERSTARSRFANTVEDNLDYRVPNNAQPTVECRVRRGGTNHGTQGRFYHSSDVKDVKYHNVPSGLVRSPDAGGEGRQTTCPCLHCRSARFCPWIPVHYNKLIRTVCAEIVKQGADRFPQWLPPRPTNPRHPV